MRRLRVLVVDDHALVRAGVRAIVDRDPDLEVVGEAADGVAATAQAASLRPDNLRKHARKRWPSA